jgi:hypothetical protein
MNLLTIFHIYTHFLEHPPKGRRDYVPSLLSIITPQLMALLAYDNIILIFFRHLTQLLLERRLWSNERLVVIFGTRFLPREPIQHLVCRWDSVLQQGHDQPTWVPSTTCDSCQGSCNEAVHTIVSFERQKCHRAHLGSRGYCRGRGSCVRDERHATTLGLRDGSISRRTISL